MNVLSVIPLNVFLDRFIEGGPLFMTLILICFLLALFFIVIGFLNLKKNANTAKKMIRLASEVSILGLVIGFLGSIIGMITAFDAIESIGDVSTGVMAAGLKVSFLTTIFGVITFIFPRIGIIIFKALQKN